jgi:hypothetical protein
MRQISVETCSNIPISLPNTDIFDSTLLAGLPQEISEKWRGTLSNR